MFDTKRRVELYELLSWPEDAEERGTSTMDSSARASAAASGFDVDKGVAAMMEARRQAGLETPGGDSE